MKDFDAVVEAVPLANMGVEEKIRSIFKSEVVVVRKQVRKKARLWGGKSMKLIETLGFMIGRTVSREW